MLSCPARTTSCATRKPLLASHSVGIRVRAHRPVSDDSSGWQGDEGPVACAGKDIIRFHTVMWPALLMSAGLPTPQRVFGHGFLTKDGLKMGKALGNVLDPIALVAAYGADAIRFYFMKEIRFGQVQVL